MINLKLVRVFLQIINVNISDSLSNKMIKYLYSNLYRVYDLAFNGPLFFFLNSYAMHIFGQLIGKFWNSFIAMNTITFSKTYKY